MAKQKPVKRYKKGSSVDRGTADKAISEKNERDGFGGGEGRNAARDAAAAASKKGSSVSSAEAQAAMASKGLPGISRQFAQQPRAAQASPIAPVNDYIQLGRLTEHGALQRPMAVPGDAATPADYAALGVRPSISDIYAFGGPTPPGYSGLPPSPAPVGTAATAPTGSMSPQQIAANTAATAGGVPMGVGIPGVGPMIGGMQNFFGGVRDVFSGDRPFFGEGGFLPADTRTSDDWFAEQAEMSRGSDRQSFMNADPVPTEDLAPETEAVPEMVDPVAPTVPYTPVPPPVPTYGYQSYNDLMAAAQMGYPVGMAGGGMVQPGMTSAFAPGSYYASYDPRRRGLGGM